MLPGLDVVSEFENLSVLLSIFNFAGARMWYVASNPQRVTRVRVAPHNRFLPTALIQLEGEALTSLAQTRPIASPAPVDTRA
jgi:hypothetical protein